MIDKLLPLLSLASSLLFIKSEKLIHARFSFCFAVSFSSLTLYAFGNFFSSIGYLTILSVFSSGLIGFIENKFKLTLCGKTSFKHFLSLILASTLIIYLSQLETSGLLASAFIAVYAIIFKFNILKRFMALLLFEGSLFPFIEIYFKHSLLSIILLTIVFCSSLILAYAANFIFNSKLNYEGGAAKNENFNLRLNRIRWNK
ncbi:hypothetical protein KEJ50_03310 [Candidatus Bathyarchaeota archaeon]|nr:hypothetical protein [Candidatus Bathyarchaeota archaeon]